MNSTMIRRSAPLALAAALTLSACSGQEKATFDSSTATSAQTSNTTSGTSSSTTDGGEDADPGPASAEAAGIDLTQLGDPIATATVPAEVEDDPKATLTVRMYGLERQGDTLIGTYSFALQSTGNPDPGTDRWLYSYLGDSSWNPTLIDTVNLTLHGVLTAQGVKPAKTDSQGTHFRPGQTLYAYAAFAAPPADVTSMSANLVDGAPPVEVKIQ